MYQLFVLVNVLKEFVGELLHDFRILTGYAFDKESNTAILDDFTSCKEIIGPRRNGIYLTYYPLADPGGRRRHAPPQQDQFLSFLHTFSPKSVCVKVGAPPNGKSWIRHCYLYLTDAC